MTAAGVFARLDDTAPPAAVCHHCGSARRVAGGLLWECGRCGRYWLRLTPVEAPQHVARQLDAVGPAPRLALADLDRPVDRLAAKTQERS